MDNNRKKYFHIDADTSTDTIFAMLDTVQSDNEEDIDELMNDSDTEFIAAQEIDGVDEPDNNSILTPEANVHVASITVAKVGKKQSDKKLGKAISNGKILVSRIFESNAILKEKLDIHFENMQHHSKYTRKLSIWMYW